MPALINAVTLVNTIHTLTGSGSNRNAHSFSTGVIGTPILSYDDNFSSYWGQYAKDDYGYWVKALATAQHEFATTLYISQVKVKAYVQSNRQSSWGGYRTPNFVSIYLKQSGVWNLLFNDQRSAINWQVDYDDSSGWLCEGIKVEVESSSEGPSSEDSYCEARLFEVQAFYSELPPFSASGIILQKATGKVSIGMAVLDDSHKIRVLAPDGVVYGIPLVATNDVNASPVRTWDGTSVKSLPQAA